MTDTSREALIAELRSACIDGTLHATLVHKAADMLEADAQQVAVHYDQQAMELCPECGWKAIMPGEPCFVCNLKTEAQQVAAPPTLTPPDGWAEAVEWAGKVAKMEQTGATLGPALAAMSKAILNMDKLMKDVKP